MDTLTITQNFEQANLKGFGYIFEDSQHAINFEKVRKLPDSAFTALEKTGLSFSPSRNVHWLKFHLKNETEKSFSLILEADNPRINRLKLFIVNNDTLVPESKILGDDFPFYDRAKAYHNFLFNIELPAKSKYTCYVFNDKFSEGFYINYSLYSLNRFHEQKESKTLIITVYLGILLFVVFISALFAFSIRTKLALYFLMYSGSVFMFTISRIGIGFQYIWYNNQSFNSICNNLFYVLLIFSIIGITQSYLKTKQYLPKIDRTLQVVKIVLCGFLIYLLFHRVLPVNIKYIVIYLSMMMQVVYLIIIPLAAYKRFIITRDKNFLFFFFGFLSVFIANIVSVLTQIEILNSVNFSEKLTYTAFLFDLLVILYLVGLGVKNAFVQNQKLAIELNEIKIVATTSLMKGQQTERQKLSQELDNNVNTKLNMTKQSLVKLKQTNEPEINALIEEIEELSKDLSSFSQKINPLDLKKESLAKAIGDLVEKLNQVNSSISLSFNNSLSEKVELSDLKSHAIFLSAQELINNALKYAEASKIEVQLYRVKDKLILAVKDNGIGFETTQKAEGIGLKNIKNRATFFNGKFEIESNDSGSKFKFSIPISD